RCHLRPFPTRRSSDLAAIGPSGLSSTCQTAQFRPPRPLRRFVVALPAQGYTARCFNFTFARIYGRDSASGINHEIFARFVVNSLDRKSTRLNSSHVKI